MLVVYSLDYASLFVCAILAAAVMVVMRLLSEQEARDAVEWPLYVAIASAFGISTALTNSGVAKGVASFLITIGESFGIGGESRVIRSRVKLADRVYGLNHFSRLKSTDAGLIGAVYFATSLISAFVTNNAAAALMFPIAMGAAEGAGINVKLMSYAVMLGASDFSTPFGYQTNLMVYGPGGYKVRSLLGSSAFVLFRSLTLPLYIFMIR
jgi:di/tricarboxylate transporter